MGLCVAEPLAADGRLEANSRWAILVEKSMNKVILIQLGISLLFNIARKLKYNLFNISD